MIVAAVVAVVGVVVAVAVVRAVVGGVVAAVAVEHYCFLINIIVGPPPPRRLLNLCNRRPVLHPSLKLLQRNDYCRGGLFCCGYFRVGGVDFFASGLQHIRSQFCFRQMSLGNRDFFQLLSRVLSNVLCNSCVLVSWSPESVGCPC